MNKSNQLIRMKQISTYALLLLISLSNLLLAQTPPVVTLSANTFYRGDAAGTYTITCPAGTNAGVSVLTKIADVPLLDPASVQYGVGVAFPWPASSSASPILTGTLPQSNTQSVMGKVIYNAGVLSGTAYCNAIPAINSSSTAFTLTLNGTTRDEAPQVQARVTYALKANSVKLPQLGTTEQNTLPPQQAGNLVYNIDQQKMAVHNGTTWQYLAPAEAGQFKNEKMFVGSATWTVPAGVTRILAEVWSGGAGGPVYAYTGNGNTTLLAAGGGAGGYGRGFMAVTPGSSLTLTVGQGGTGAVRSPSTWETNGGNSSVTRNGIGDGIVAYGAYYNNGGTSLGIDLGFAVNGSAGTNGTISYGQKSSSEYILLIQCGNGGTAYSAPPGGSGTQIASLNSSVLLYQSGDNTSGQEGSFPGGGGGCGYNYGGDGARGMIVLHW